jgi:hypothetical protein
MKQKIFEALKAKFEGVSDAVLNRIAEKSAKTVTTEEAVQGAVDSVTFQQIIDGEADRRATEATQSAVTNYEKKHGLKDGQKVETGGAAEKNDSNKKEDSNENDTPAWAKAIIESNKTLSEKLSALEGEKVTFSRKQKLDAIIGKLPDGLRKPYSRIPLKDMTDDEFDTFITETTTEVDTLSADFAVKGSVLKVPIGGGATKKEPSKEDAAEIISGII